MDKTNICLSFLHDAELIGLRFDRISFTAQLFFLHGDIEHIVEAKGVKAIRGEDFIVQNVVNRVLCSRFDAFPKQELLYWIDWVTSLSDASSWLLLERKNEWLAAFGAHSLELMVLEPSFGAKIALVCEDFEVMQIQKFTSNKS